MRPRLYRLVRAAIKVEAPGHSPEHGGSLPFQVTRPWPSCPKLLHQIPTQDIRDWLDEQALHLKRSTLFNVYLGVNQVLKYATKRRMLEIDPFSVDPMKFRGSRRKRVDIPIARTWSGCASTSRTRDGPPSIRG